MVHQIESERVVTQQVARDNGGGATIQSRCYPQSDPIAIDCASGSMIQRLPPVPPGYMRLRNHPDHVVVPLRGDGDF